MAAGPKQRLLESLEQYFAEHGVGDTSLRGMAAAIGTSHRMLIYHFGSREKLLMEVARSVELEQREAFAMMLDDPATSSIGIMRTVFEQIFSGDLRPQEQLFFELYVHALRGEPEASVWVPEVVEAWTPPLAKLFRQAGFDRDEAEAEARLLLATSRGLLLDFLATGDRQAIDAAADRYFSRFEE